MSHDATDPILRGELRAYRGACLILPPRTKTPLLPLLLPAPMANQRPTRGANTAAWADKADAIKRPPIPRRGARRATSRCRGRRRRCRIAVQNARPIITSDARPAIRATISTSRMCSRISAVKAKVRGKARCRGRRRSRRNDPAAVMRRWKFELHRSGLQETACLQALGRDPAAHAASHVGIACKQAPTSHSAATRFGKNWRRADARRGRRGSMLT